MKELESTEEQIKTAKIGYESRFKKVSERLKDPVIPKEYIDEFSNILEEMQFAVQTNDIDKIKSLEIRLNKIKDKFKP